MTAPAGRKVGGRTACPAAAPRDYIAGQVAELYADFTPDADVADAELRRFGGYVEPGDDGFDLLYEASVNGADASAAELLDEATEEANWQLRRLINRVRDGVGGPDIADDLDDAAAAYRARAVTAVRDALASRGGKAA